MKKAFLFLAIFTSTIQLSWAQVNKTPRELENVDISDKLGTKAPLDLVFKDEDGNDVTLGKYFHQGKPVALVLAYYECPMLCTFVLNTLADNVSKIPNWTAGKEFQIVTVSISPKETPAMAKEKKKNYLATIKQAPDSPSWAFLTDPNNNSKKLADAIGFQYYYDKTIGEYAHPAVTFILSDEGVLSRDLFGLTYAPKDLKFALLEASKGKIGNMIEKILLFCYHYDPDAKGYVLFAQNVMKVSGLVSVLFLGLFLGFLWKLDIRKMHKEEERIV